MSSVDGRLLTDRWTPPFDGKSKNELLGIYAAIGRKLDTDAWMFGKRTLTEGFFPQEIPAGCPQDVSPPGNLRSLPLVRTPVHRGRPRSGHSLRLVHRAGRQHRCHPAGDDSSRLLGAAPSAEHLLPLRRTGRKRLAAGDADARRSIRREIPLAARRGHHRRRLPASRTARRVEPRGLSGHRRVGLIALHLRICGKRHPACTRPEPRTALD